jgi:quercetin dioxygenase-like cupin family protein
MTVPRLGVLAVTMAAALAGPARARAETDAAGFVRVKPDQIVWTDMPGFEGVKFAVIEGDPKKPGIYVIRVKFSPGRMTRPHWHPEDRHATVLSGTWYTGEGDTFDPSKTVALGPGSYMKHPAKAHHFDGAKDEEVVLQIVGYGPSGTTLVHPEEGHTGSSLAKK